MIIRKFKKSDLNQILEMTKEAWNGFSFDQMLEQRFGKMGKRWWRYKTDSLKSSTEAHPEQVLVAEENGKVIGYATYGVDKKRKIGQVSNNAVHPKFRGRGIGSKLHRKVLEQLKKEGMEAVFLSTPVINIPAIKMYESAGFKKIWHNIYYAKKLDSGCKKKGIEVKIAA